MRLCDLALTLAALVIYLLYWIWLTPERRFIRRNKLRSHMGTRE